MKWTLSSVYAVMIVFLLFMWKLRDKVESEGKMPLTLLSWNGPERQKQVDEFNEKYPKYKLRIDPDNGGITKVVVQYSANMGGDIIDFVSQANIQTYTGAGILLDLMDSAKNGGRA